MICSGCEDDKHDRCIDGQMNSAQTGPILCDCASKEHDYKKRPKAPAVTCETSEGTGNFPCGATDCGPKPFPDCYCDSCSEAGKKIYDRRGGKSSCYSCYLDEKNAREEDAWDDRPGRG